MTVNLCLECVTDLLGKFQRSLRLSLSIGRDCGLCTKERAARQRWNLVCVVEWICERLRPVHQRTRGSAKVESRLCESG